MARFAEGEAVRVRNAYPPGHLRTPYYIRGKAGVIERLLGRFPNPEELAFGSGSCWRARVKPEKMRRAG